MPVDLLPICDPRGKRMSRLTELACTRAKAKPGLRTDLFDGPGGVPGLCLRISSSGTKSWSLLFRIAGKQHRVSLGRYPQVGLAEARAQARAILERADDGIDPAPARRRDSFADVVEQYLRL